EATSATSHVIAGSQAADKNDVVDAEALLIATSSFFAPYEALAARAHGAAPGTIVQAYAEGPMIAFTIRLGDTFTEQIQTTSPVVSARRTHVVMQFPGTAIDADIWVDETGRMIRWSVPAQALDVVREDIAAVSSRTITISRPNDEKITIPGNGFTL